MAACGSLRHIFENPIPENNSSSSSNSSLIDSLSSPWKQIKPLKPPLDHHSLTEIFGELHFKENHPIPIPSSSSFFTPPLTSSSGSAALPIEPIPESSENGNQKSEKTEGRITITPFSTTNNNNNNEGYPNAYHHRRSDSFSSLNSDSLQFCTEGLGSESLDDADDLEMTDKDKKCQESSNTTTMMMMTGEEKAHVRRHSGDSCYSYCRSKRGSNNGRAVFPPPISYIGHKGKPSVSFQSYRQNGRFVLKEVKIPTQECLQASREDGRLRLSFVHSNDDDYDENVDDDDDDDDGDGGGGEEEEGGFEKIEEAGEREEEDGGVMEGDEGEKLVTECKSE